MKYVQILLDNPRGITLKYNHTETNQTYGLLITYTSLNDSNLESMLSWIDKCKTFIARQVYIKHSVILDGYEPSHFEKSKLSSEDYLKQGQKESKEYWEKQRKKNKFLNEADSLMGDLLLGIRFT